MLTGLGGFENSHFGYCSIRYALDDGFNVVLPAGRASGGSPAWVVRVIDPQRRMILFGIDNASHVVRKVGFETPGGWHKRIYSDFFMVKDPGFLQAGRVRLDYDSAIVGDVRPLDPSRSKQGDTG